MGLVIEQAWRAWRSARGVAVLAILALTVGIGSAVSIYTIVNAVLLRPLPFQHGDRWVVVFATKQGARPNEMQGVTDPDLLYLKQRAHSFDAFGWFAVLGDFNLTAPGQPQHLHGLWVTPSLVNNLGIPMVKGRWFREVRDEPSGAHSAVISQSLWQRLGAPADIIGKTIALDGVLYTVTGVAPPWFRLAAFNVGTWITPEDVWVTLDEWARQNDKSGAYLAYARLRPGVRLGQANAEIKQIAAEIVRKNPYLDPNYTAGVRSLKETVSEPIRSPLLLLLGATGLLLLITCANVSGLLVARSVHRARETAIRVALGAGRLQFGLQYFTEGFLVAAVGAVLGVAGSYAALHVILRLGASYIPRADEIRIDASILFFATGLAFVTALLSCLAPLWQAVRTQPNEALSEGTRSSAGLRSRRVSRSLVVLEIGLAFTLLSAAALLRGNANFLLRSWPGFDAQNLSVFDLQPSGPAYSDDKKLAQYEQRLLAALQSVPGVENVAIGSQLPMGGCCFNSQIVSEDPGWTARYAQEIDFALVSTDYFRTLRIPLLAGRLLNEHDDTEHPIHVVVNEAAAKHFWPSGKVIGGFGRFSGITGDPFQVVGVVADVRIDTLDKPAPPELYIFNTQGRTSPLHVFLRSHISEFALSQQVRRAVQSVDRAQPIYEFSSMQEILQSSMLLQRGTSEIAGFFAVASLLMAMLGIYGVTSYFVRQRTVELGTRMALGAEPNNLLRLVLDSGWKLCAAGLATGAAATALATLLLINNFNVHHVSWQAFLYTILIVAVVTTLASLFPAWRATLLTPMAAIRDSPEDLVAGVRRSVRGLVSQLGQAGPPAAAAQQVLETTLLTEFIDAARKAESFDAAIQATLKTLQHQVNSESIVLLEKSTNGTYVCIAALPIQCSLIVSPQGFLLKRMRFYPLALPIAEDDYPVLRTWAATQRPEYTQELEDLEQRGVRLAVGLRTHREILGVLLLGRKVDRGPYTNAEKRLLRMCSEQLALMLENGRLTERVVEQEKLRRDLALAIEVQKRLLPERSPEMKIGELAAYTLPARSVGGDYYDFLQVGDHRVGVALADVAGKGIAAALIMSVVQASLRVLLADGNISLPDLAAKMNRFLHRSTGANSYATFFYAQVDENTRELRYVNAGHNPPFLLRRDPASVEALACGGMIIGLFPMAAYEEGTVKLRSGDVLIVFTDGVTEALNSAGEEFGEERLQTLLKNVAHLSAKDMAHAIANELRAWIGAADQHDDLTFVVLKVD
ncbi:MAG TPA: ADOP family duplicated permease [Bryobacteraceae bacterium]|jgi:predicted permease|nr:ADOP family duplicated permease [Bryobacteraceae bacterium]